MDRKPCSLICMISPELIADWITQLPALAAEFRPAALIVSRRLSPDLEPLLKAAKRIDLAMLIETYGHDFPETAEGLYVLDGAECVKQARQKLGDKVIIGASSPLSRHDAMTIAEAGADFIAFTALNDEDLVYAMELCQWWDELTTVQCAIVPQARTLTPDAVYSARADFIILRDEMKAGDSLNLAKQMGLVGA